MSSLPISVRAKLIADQIINQVQLKRLDMSPIPPSAEETPKRKKKPDYPSTKTPESEVVGGRTKREEIMQILHKLKSPTKIQQINKESLEQLFEIFSELMANKDPGHLRTPSSSIPQARRTPSTVKDPIKKCLNREFLQRNKEGVRSLSNLTKSLKLQVLKKASQQSSTGSLMKAVYSRLHQHTQSSRMKRQEKNARNSASLAKRLPPKIKVREVNVELDEIIQQLESKKYNTIQ